MENALFWILLAFETKKTQLKEILNSDKIRTQLKLLDFVAFKFKYRFAFTYAHLCILIKVNLNRRCSAEICKYCIL